MSATFHNHLSAAQSLVNAQVSVNRAAWAMNEQSNAMDSDTETTKHGGDISDRYIMDQINAAITDLTCAIQLSERSVNGKKA